MDIIISKWVSFDESVSLQIMTVHVFALKKC